MKIFIRLSSSDTGIYSREPKTANEIRSADSRNKTGTYRAAGGLCRNTELVMVAAQLTMSSRIEIFDKRTISQLAWPENPLAQWTKRYVVPFVTCGPKHFIDNADVEMLVLTGDGLVLPLVVNEGKPGNSDVCSPYAHFVSYTAQELSRRSGVIPALLRMLVRAAQWLFQATRIDRVVYVNNWLLATSPDLDVSKDWLADVTDYLSKRFPDHAVVFRCINPITACGCFEALRMNRYRLVPSRIVYMFEPSKEPYNKNRDRKRDLRLLETGEYAVIDSRELTDEDIKQMTALYRDLYLGKYSDLNPQFNENFFSLVVKQEVVELRALKSDRVVAFTGYYLQEKSITGCTIGYDRRQPVELGLYRRAYALLMRASDQKKKLLNMSAGVGEFKRLRGATPCVEYDAIFDRHLPWHRRLGWWFVQLGVQFSKLARGDS
jgi:hypothetical protein